MKDAFVKEKEEREKEKGRDEKEKEDRKGKKMKRMVKSGKVGMKKKLLPKKKKVFNNDRHLELEVDNFSERFKVEKKIPLKGGALLFQNRADRIMVLKDNIDEVNERVFFFSFCI